MVSPFGLTWPETTALPVVMEETGPVITVGGVANVISKFGLTFEGKEFPLLPCATEKIENVNITKEQSATRYQINITTPQKVIKVESEKA